VQTMQTGVIQHSLTKTIYNQTGFARKHSQDTGRAIAQKRCTPWSKSSTKVPVVCGTRAQGQCRVAIQIRPPPCGKSPEEFGFSADDGVNVQSSCRRNYLHASQ
jgi:hypothetical protein